MKNFWLVIAMMALLVTSAFSENGTDEERRSLHSGNVLSADERTDRTPIFRRSGHISAIYGYNPIDSLIGLSGSYETDFKHGDFEVDAQLQSGDIVEGDAHLAIAFDVGPVQLKPFTEVNTIKTADWGRTLDGGAKLNIPLRDSGVDVAIGMFARNSKAFIPLQHGTRNPVTGEVTWEDATLLNFDNLGLLNALFETQFAWKRVDVGLTGIFDVSNQEFHQLIIELSTSWQLTQRLQFSMMLEHIVQAGDAGGQQADATFAIGYKF